MSFEELDVWKRACKLAVDVYVVLKDCREFGQPTADRRPDEVVKSG